MLVAGETLRADELREQLGLSPDVFDLDAAQIEAQRALANEAYLSLRLPASSVLFVHDEETLSRYDVSNYKRLVPVYRCSNTDCLHYVAVLTCLAICLAVLLQGQ